CQLRGAAPAVQGQRGAPVSVLVGQKVDGRGAGGRRAGQGQQKGQKVEERQEGGGRRGAGRRLRVLSQGRVRGGARHVHVHCGQRRQGVEARQVDAQRGRGADREHGSPRP